MIPKIPDQKIVGVILFDENDYLIAIFQWYVYLASNVLDHI